MKKKLLEYLYFTPIESKDVVPLFRHGQWITVHTNEIVLAHKSHREILERYGFRVVDKISVFKTKKAAREARKHLSLKPSE